MCVSVCESVRVCVLVCDFFWCFFSLLRILSNGFSTKRSLSKRIYKFILEVKSPRLSSRLSSFGVAS